MSFYDNLATTADRLIAKYGQTVTFSRYAPTADPITGAVVKGAATLTSSASVVVLPASKGTVEAFDNRREALVAAGKILRYLKVAPSITFEPMPDDEVTMNSRTWQVLGCTPVNPAGTALVYGVGMVQL